MNAKFRWHHIFVWSIGFPIPKNEGVRDGFEVRYFKRAPLQKAVQIGNYRLAIGEQITFRCAFKSIDRSAVSNAIISEP